MTGTSTKIDFREIDKILEKYEYKKSYLIAMLQNVQEVFRYLPEEAMTYIGEKVDGLSPATVYGVATFYAQFSMSPKGKYIVAVCLGTACYVKGAGKVLEEVEKILGIGDGDCTPDGKFSLEVCRCVGACGLAPVMIVAGDVYGKMTPDRVEGILAKYE